MEVNRHQYFYVGLVLLFLGLQYQFIDSLVLRPDCAQLLRRVRNPPVAASSPLGGLVPPAVKPATVYPPDWVSWALLSLGAVLVLHSLAMPKPG